VRGPASRARTPSTRPAAETRKWADQATGQGEKLQIWRTTNARSEKWRVTIGTRSSCAEFPYERSLCAKFPGLGLKAASSYPFLVDWYVFLVAVLVLAGLAGFGLHRLIRNLGDLGLVDYQPARPTKKSVGGAMMTFQAFFEPAVEHVIEYQRSGDLTIQTTGEPDPDQRAGRNTEE
jgi:hypothetical protein